MDVRVGDLWLRLVELGDEVAVAEACAVVWRGEDSDDPHTCGLVRRIYSDRDLDPILLEKLVSLA